MSADAAVEPLACPSCARRYPLSERFCPNCGMPLVYVGQGEEGPVTDEHERARKVKPQYVGGELVKVGWGRNQAEAELIQGLLLEEGIPSVERRSRGFDVPDFLAGGPRDILVSEAAYDAARALLEGVEGPPAEQPVTGALGAGEASPARLALWIVIAVSAAAALVFVLYQLAT